MASSSFNYTQLITALFSLGLIIIETKSWPSSEFLLLSFKQQLIQRCEWVMTPMTWLMRKNLAWRITCYMHCTLSTILNNHIWVLTTLVVKLTAICDQMSVRYKANKSSDRESQFSELRRSQRKKKIDKNLSDSFIIQTTYSKRLKSCIPIPQSSWGIKVGMRPIVSCKKEWFMALPNWSFATIYQSEQK